MFGVWSELLSCRVTGLAPALARLRWPSVSACRGNARARPLNEEIPSRGRGLFQDIAIASRSRPTRVVEAAGSAVKAARSVRQSKKRRRGFPRRLLVGVVRRTQRSSWRTLCCEVLASDSADTAIDWRVDSAWLLAASALVSASVRLDEPVCSTLIRSLEKS
jgi:hypothetical protein